MEDLVNNYDSWKLNNHKTLTTYKNLNKGNGKPSTIQSRKKITQGFKRSKLIGKWRVISRRYVISERMLEATMIFSRREIILKLEQYHSIKWEIFTIRLKYMNLEIFLSLTLLSQKIKLQRDGVPTTAHTKFYHSSQNVKNKKNHVDHTMFSLLYESCIRNETAMMQLFSMLHYQ